MKLPPTSRGELSRSEMETLLHAMAHAPGLRGTPLPSPRPACDAGPPLALAEAAAMIAFTRQQILQQAGLAMLRRANAGPQSVLGLLR